MFSFLVFRIISIIDIKSSVVNIKIRTVCDNMYM